MYHRAEIHTVKYSSSNKRNSTLYNTTSKESAILPINTVLRFLATRSKFQYARDHEWVSASARFHCCSREPLEVNKLSIRGWNTTMKDCRISKRARPFCWLASWEPVRPLSGRLYSSQLSAYLRSGNMRISRRKLQLSLKGYAHNSRVTTWICDLTGADWIVHSVDAKLLERGDPATRRPVPRVKFQDNWLWVIVSIHSISTTFSFFSFWSHQSYKS